MCLPVAAGAVSLLFNPSPPPVGAGKVNSDHGNLLSSWSEGAHSLCGWTFILCVRRRRVKESDISRF